MTLIVVKAAFDAEAGVGYVESSDLPGLNLEAATVESLQQQTPLAPDRGLSRRWRWR